MHPSIALWSHPRSMSTALERSFIERGDFKVFHEAFAYVFFMHEERAAIPHKKPDPDHPLTYPDIKQMMESARHERPVFHKDFPYHCLDHLLDDPEYLLGQVNTFLVRDPEEAVLSHANHLGLPRDISPWIKASATACSPPPEQRGCHGMRLRLGILEHGLLVWHGCATKADTRKTSLQPVRASTSHRTVESRESS